MRAGVGSVLKMIYDRAAFRDCHTTKISTESYLGAAELKSIKEKEEVTTIRNGGDGGGGGIIHMNCNNIMNDAVLINYHIRMRTANRETRRRWNSQKTQNPVLYYWIINIGAVCASQTKKKDTKLF